MNTVVLQLHRRHGSAGMTDHKAEILREPDGRNPDNCHAVQEAHNALQTHFYAHIGIVELDSLFQKGVDRRRDNQDTLRVRDLRIIESFRSR